MKYYEFTHKFYISISKSTIGDKMELEEFVKRIEKLGKAISREKGEVLAHIFKYRERTYDQLALAVDESKLGKCLRELEELGLVKSNKELLHPIRLEGVYTLSNKGLYYLTTLESMFERENTFVEAFVLRLAELGSLEV